jgi:hypothetical protein
MLLMGANPVPLAISIIGLSECSEWSFETQYVFFLHVAEHVFGESAMRHVSDMQLDKLVIVRGVGHRIAAPLAITQKNVDVLTREKLQALVRRQLQFEYHDIFGHLVYLLNAAWKPSDLQCADTVDFACFYDQITGWSGLAKQRVAGAFLEFGECAGLRTSIVDGPGQNLALA